MADEDLKKGVWLESGCTLEYYLLRNGVSGEWGVGSGVGGMQEVSLVVTKMTSDVTCKSCGLVCIINHVLCTMCCMYCTPYAVHSP